MDAWAVVRKKHKYILCKKSFKPSGVLSPVSLIICLVMGQLCVVPCSSGHDAASVFGPRLAAACTVMAHAEVVAHLVCHGGGDTHS